MGAAWKIRAAAFLAGIAAIALVVLFSWNREKPVPEDETKTVSPEKAAASETESPLLRFRSDEDIPVFDTATSWRTYHGNTALTGIAERGMGDALDFYWRFQAGAAVRTTPVILRDTIFFVNDRGTIFALGRDGAEKWSRTLTAGVRSDGTPRPAYFDAPPACFENLLLAGEGMGFLFALNPETGETRWKQEIEGGILGTSLLADVNGRETVFTIGQAEGRLHALDAADGSITWIAEGVSRCDGPPSSDGRHVVFGSCASALHIFSAATGEMLHEAVIDEDSQVASGVALREGKAYAGSRSGKVLRADLETGATDWVKHDTEYEVFSTPAVDGRHMLHGARDGFLYCRDPQTGNLRWKTELGGEPASPVIAGNRCIASAEGVLFLIALEDGGILWSHEISDEITAPAVAGGQVVVGCDDGTVAAFAAAG
jgi:outer membrane protein assembly factor BamB